MFLSNPKYLTNYGVTFVTVVGVCFYTGMFCYSKTETHLSLKQTVYNGIISNRIYVTKSKFVYIVNHWDTH